MPDRRILAVDDDALNRDILEILLADDYELTLAASGDEALALAKKLRPELVLLDVVMPGMDGYQACRLMRAEESLRDTKIILVSGKAMEDERRAGLDAGADDYVTKPFDHDELLAKIEAFLPRKAA